MVYNKDNPEDDITVDQLEAINKGKGVSLK